MSADLGRYTVNTRYVFFLFSSCRMSGRCTGRDQKFTAEGGGSVVIQHVVFGWGNGRASRGTEVLTADTFPKNCHIATMKYLPVPRDVTVEQLNLNDARFVVSAPLNACDESNLQIVKWVLDNDGCIRRKSNKQPFVFGELDFVVQKPKAKPKNGWNEWGKAYVELIGFRFFFLFRFYKCCDLTHCHGLYLGTAVRLRLLVA